ncbi:MAG: hypothetical protein AAF598_06335 [Bacteroidota bacterium]
MNRQQLRWVLLGLMICVLIRVGYLFLFSGHPQFSKDYRTKSLATFSDIHLPQLDVKLQRLSYRSYLAYVEILPATEIQPTAYRFQDQTLDIEGLFQALQHWKANLPDQFWSFASFLTILADQDTPMAEIHRMKGLAGELGCLRIKYLVHRPKEQRWFGKRPQYEFQEGLHGWLFNANIPAPPIPLPKQVDRIQLAPNGHFMWNGTELAPNTFFEKWSSQTDSTYRQSDRSPYWVISDEMTLQTYLEVLYDFRKIYRAEQEHLAQTRFQQSYDALSADLKKQIQPIVIWQPIRVSEERFTYYFPDF